MSNDGSLGGSAFPFDIDSQKGLMTLLASIRASKLTAPQKNELRDLAFLYTNGGKDQSVRITLQQKVLSYALQPLAPIVPEVTVAPQPVFGFGTSRPVPSIRSAAPRAAEVIPQPSVESVPASVAVPAQVQPQPIPVAAPLTSPVQVPVSAPVPPPPPPVPTPVPVAEVIPPPVSASVPVTPPPPGPASVISTPETPEVTESMPMDIETASQRIRQIKTMVNDKVGNPVNLVDINNEVGREYMAALLDAMKKLNSGTSVISAMKRLEDAFTVVEATLKERAINPPPAAAPTPVSTPFPEPIPVPTPASVQPVPQPIMEPEPAPVPVVPEVPLPVSEPESAAEAVVPPPSNSVPQEEIANFNHVQESVPLRPADEVARNVSPQDSDYVVSVRQDIKDVEKTAATPVPIRKEPVKPVVESSWGPATDTLQPVTVPTATLKKVVSLAETSEKLHLLTDLPEASELATSSVAGDPLFTNEIDEGLQQLLQEWPIFKKSGLFGTGPKGREHPLFVKIAGLQIPLLLAGRFEGATQEIRQSIADYMNGWRYEQGIIYEQGETFEHYLRRVIRHILDLQKNRQHP